MSEQYKCDKCGYVYDMSDMMCSECGDGVLELLRWTKGGNGSHWEGCEEVHWDCKIAQLEAEIDRRDEIITRLKEDGERLVKRFVVVDPDDGVSECIQCNGSDYLQENNVLVHMPDCPITLHRALMKELE